MKYMATLVVMSNTGTAVGKSVGSGPGPSVGLGDVVIGKLVGR